MLKPELYKLATTYQKTAYHHGHDVLPLPPYHCEPNPIDLIWSQVKSKLSLRNTVLTLKATIKLAENALKDLTKDDW